MGNFFNSEAKFRSQVEKLTSEVLGNSGKTEWCNRDDIMNIDSMRSALGRAGVEACSLIVGIDFTGSNRMQGRESFHGECLHAIGSKHGPNPYEQALGLIGQALAPFDGGPGDVVPSFVFGDAQTRHHSVRALRNDSTGMSGVLDAYREAAKRPTFSGPTSFAPLIDKAVEVVRSRGNVFHVLVIVADGQVDNEMECLSSTKAAIVRAAGHPLSIVMVGVGDGPWETMNDFDDELPERQFDNFQFVAFSKFQALLKDASAAQQKVIEAAFAVCALQEVPAQVAAAKALGMLTAGSAPVGSPPATAAGAKRPRPEECPEAPGAKRSRQEPGSGARSTWSCASCTYQSHSASASCEVCGASRSAFDCD